MKKINYSKIPDKKKEPWSYHRWKEMDLLKATPLERLIMLELENIFVISDWLYQRETTWDKKDMRKFVRDLAEKIEKLKLAR